MEEIDPYYRYSQQQVPLPPLVEDLITDICARQNQQPLGVDARQELASAGEARAVDVLKQIHRNAIKKSFDGYVIYLCRQFVNNNSNTFSPTRNFPSSPPPPPPPPYSPHHQGQRSHSLTPTRLIMNSQGHSVVRSPIPMDLTCSERGTRFDGVSPELEALGKLEFPKAFLILSYIGGNRVEDVLSVDTIQSLKHKPMSTFEGEVWNAVGSKCGYIKETERIKFCNWDSRKTHIYHCYVHPDGSYRFKGPYLTQMSNFLQRSLGDDNVLLVKFSEEKSGERGSASHCSDYFEKYKKVIREGIIVGLHCYRFFVFKDGGKAEKKKDPTTSPVKCVFVRMESFASIDNEDYILRGKTVHQARSIFMHVGSLPSLGNYMARFSLILSKTINLEVDLSHVNIEVIDDKLCLDENGNSVCDKDGKPLIFTDGTGFISQDLAWKCPKNICKENHINADNVERLLHPCGLKRKFAEMSFPKSACGEPPLLMQFRLFNKGMAVKGTLLINKKLDNNTIHVRPSMIKVKSDPELLNIPTQNSLEIVGRSNRPKKAFLSKNLIALLSYGGVPNKVFMDLLSNALEDAKNALLKKNAALRVAVNAGEMDDFILVKMIFTGMPLEESFLQYRLSALAKEEKKSLKGGKIPVPDSYYLMGTADPTGLLESDEVCVILDSGQVSGKVLVYRNPGLHFGDVHLLKATYVKELEDLVGNAKYAIFFPCKGPRSLADEMGGGDYDGDMYFVTRNPQLLEYFEPSEPWKPSSPNSTHRIPEKELVKLSDEELEEQLFKLFLETRFRPSYTVGMAADSWLAIMDRFLTLGDDRSDEKANMKEILCQLVDIYYDALDAPKKGGIKVNVPKELKAELFPHHMGRNDEISYKSTSVLGLIYDTVKSFEEEEPSIQEVCKLPCFDNEVSESCMMKWEKLYIQYRQEMTAALNQKDKKDEAANEVIKRYKEILYEAGEFEESKREKEDIFEEAIAIYNICYDYAKDHGASKCGFAWKVAGSALLKLYAMSQNDEKLVNIGYCPPSVLRELLG